MLPFSESDLGGSILEGLRNLGIGQLYQEEPKTQRTAGSNPTSSSNLFYPILAMMIPLSLLQNQLYIP